MRLDARQYLEQVRKIDELITAKKEERRQLWHIATDSSAKLPDGMPHSYTGVTNRSFEDAMIKIIALDEDIGKELTRYTKIKAEICECLKKLPAKEYGVLHNHYIGVIDKDEQRIKYLTWEEIAERRGKSVRHVYRIRDKGLKILSNVIVCHVQSE